MLKCAMIQFIKLLYIQNEKEIFFIMHKKFFLALIISFVMSAEHSLRELMKDVAKVTAKILM